MLSYHIGRNLRGLSYIFSDLLFAVAKAARRAGGVKEGGLAPSPPKGALDLLTPGGGSKDDRGGTWPGTEPYNGSWIACTGVLSGVVKSVVAPRRSGSVLILGPPGSGKSSLLRDMVRVLADGEVIIAGAGRSSNSSNGGGGNGGIGGLSVVAVDKGGRLGGGAGAPQHPALGIQALRVMVEEVESIVNGGSSNSGNCSNSSDRSSASLVLGQLGQDLQPDLVVVDDICSSQVTGLGV